MKRFINNIAVFALSIPTFLLMFALLVWSIVINSLLPIIGNFKPYKWLDKVNDLFYEMERKIFNG
jgi:ABC-type dipeptide/oligopeptide/nickel transport system permease component